jgi:hypothetical protein
MKYTPEEKKEKFDLIIKDIEENGLSLRKSLSGYGMPDKKTFLNWVDKDENMRSQYVRACEARAELIFEEVLEIADKQGEDVIGEDEHGNQIINHNVISRNRLQMDARKWMLGKMNPKKYGDKLDMTSGGEKLQQPNQINISLPDGTDLSDFKIQ